MIRNIVVHIFPPFIFLFYLTILIVTDKICFYFKSRATKKLANPVTNQVLIQAVAAFYSIFLGFIIFILWNNYQEAGATIVNETTQLYFVSENIKAFTPTVAKTLNDQLSQYISFILNDEWAAMGTNRKSQKTQNEIERLYKTLLNYRPTDSTPLMYYEKAISSLESALSYRHERLHMTHVEIPIAWYVMIFLSAIITACVFSFENDSGRSYMHILLYVLLGFYLTAITILSYPFSGYATVSPQPFYDLLHTINGNYPPISGKLSPLNLN